MKDSKGCKHPTHAIGGMEDDLPQEVLRLRQRREATAFGETPATEKPIMKIETVRRAICSFFDMYTFAYITDDPDARK